MYAFLLVVTLLLPNNQSAKFYHTSHARFGDVGKCQRVGLQSGNDLLDRLRSYKGKPSVTAEVTCEKQATREV